MLKKVIVKYILSDTYKPRSLETLLNRSYVQLRNMLKIHHQALFARHFLTSSSSSWCFHVGILFTITALGISLWKNLKFLFSNRGLVVILAGMISSRIEAIEIKFQHSILKKKCCKAMSINKFSIEQFITECCKSKTSQSIYQLDYSANLQTLVKPTPT